MWWCFVGDRIEPEPRMCTSSLILMLNVMLIRTGKAATRSHSTVKQRTSRRLPLSAVVSYIVLSPMQTGKRRADCLPVGNGTPCSSKISVWCAFNETAFPLSVVTPNCSNWFGSMKDVGLPDGIHVWQICVNHWSHQSIHLDKNWSLTAANMHGKLCWMELSPRKDRIDEQNYIDEDDTQWQRET